MRQRIACLVIGLAFLVLCAYYSLVIPPFESPDEVWHYAYAREVAQNRGLPVLVDNTPQPWGQEGAQAPLYYVLGAALLIPMDPGSLAMPVPNPFAQIGEPRSGTNDNRNAFLHGRDESFPFQNTSVALHVLRLFSVLIGGLTVVLTFALAREIFPDNVIVAPAAAAFVAFLPQFLFISSSFNNDNLATLLSVAMLLCLTKMLRQGVSLARSLQAGAIAGAALLTKFNTVTLLFLAGIVILYLTIPKRRWRAALVNIGLVMLIAVMIAGWWYARNMVLYGDPTGLSLIIRMIGSRSAPIDPIRWFVAENEGLRLSTWGVFGWMNVLASPYVYALYDLLALVGCLGMLVAITRRRAFSPGLAVLVLWCAIVFGGVVYYNLQLPASQGRLLFPALGAWAILWAGGIGTLIPARLDKLVIALLAAGQLAIAALTPALYIAPAYVPSTVVAIPQDAIPINALFQNGVTVLGVRLNRTEIQPGDALDVTVYSSVPDAGMARSALFVHLTNSDNVIIAQRDTAIASGNWSRTTFPAIVADSLQILVPVSALAPDRWRVEIGVTDLETRVRWSESTTGRDVLTVANLDARSTGTSWGFDFSGHTTLNTAEITPRAGVPGGNLRVTLHMRGAPEQYRAFVHVLGESDHIWAGADEPLALDTNLDLRIALDTPPGVYPIELGIYPVDGDRLPVFDARGQLLGDRLFLGPVRINPQVAK